MNFRFLLLLLSLTASWSVRAQKGGLLPDSLQDAFRNTSGKNVCTCVDSIATGQTKEAIREKIQQCIKNQITSYEILSQLMEVSQQMEKDKHKKGKKSYNINISADENSASFQRSYNELERYVMDSCPSVKRLLMVDDESSGSQLSLSPIANDWYTKGLKATEREDYKTAVTYYRKAVETDPKFIFAWDNLGIAYRNLEQYAKAIDAYEHSLAINPRGATPLQNAAVASFSNKDYQGAIKYYKRLAAVDVQNPEVYYGLGQVYAVYLEDYENALPNICTAYNLYTAQKSPYRTDAEKIIQFIYQKMKASGKEKRFYEIMKEEKVAVENN